MKSTNERLHALYSAHWRSLVRKFNKRTFPEKKPSNPLLLCVDEQYSKADIKVVYFGQETNSWEGDFPKGIQHLLSTYRDFYLSEDCFKYGGQFFNGISKCNERLRREFSGKSVGFIWNNLIKIGKSNEKGTPTKDILAFQDEWFSVIKKEMEILNPDIAIFFTGPNYDEYITKCFADAKFVGHRRRDTKELAKVKSVSLPNMTFRTYHPHYLWWNGFYDYLNDIINWLRRTKR